MKMDQRQKNNLWGALFMVISMMGMAGTDACVKWVMETGYSTFQVVAVRGWIIVAMMMVWILATGKSGEIKTNRMRDHLIRLVLSFAGPVFMFVALAKMPVADVVVIIFGSTFMTTALSVPIFKEKVGIHRWSAVVAGFIGVVVALRPGTELFQPAAIYAVLAGAGFSCLNLTTRWLRDTESTLQITFITMVGFSVFASVTLPFVWKPIPVEQYWIFALMAVFTLIGYVFLTQAFHTGDVSIVAPYEYSVLVWAVMTGYAIWGDVPDVFIWTGAAIIVISGLYLIHREARHGGPTAAEPPAG